VEIKKQRKTDIAVLEKKTQSPGGKLIGHSEGSCARSVENRVDGKRGNSTRGRGSGMIKRQDDLRMDWGKSARKGQRAKGKDFRLAKKGSGGLRKFAVKEIFRRGMRLKNKTTVADGPGHVFPKKPLHADRAGKRVPGMRKNWSGQPSPK